MRISSNFSSEKSNSAINGNHLDKSYLVDQLILMIENVDDISVRCSCLEALEHIDDKSDKLFVNLENILISDSQDEIRKQAAKLIGEKFCNRGLDSLGYTILHEQKYANILNVLIILEKLKVDEVHHLLLEKLKDFDTIKGIEFKDYPSSTLIQILINQLTLSCLKRKFNNLEYVIEKGCVRELDFSKVNNKILDWRYREMIQEHTEIHGIKHLTRIVKITPFSLNWAIRNQYTMQCQVELLKTLGEINELFIKNTLISQIRNIKDITYRKSLDKLIETNNSFSKLSVVKLMEILINYTVIEFLKTKAPNLRFDLKEGLVRSLSIENVKLIKIPKFIEQLSSLISLRLYKCNIYEIPGFIVNLKKLSNLELSYNKIHTIPESFSELKNLKTLNLKNNRVNPSTAKLMNIHYDLIF